MIPTNDSGDVAQLDVFADERPRRARTRAREPHFNGPEYDPELDHERLVHQHERIRDVMLDGCWRTLGEIAAQTDDPESSVSAQLRHLRKPRFGSYVVEKRRRGEGRAGLYEYHVAPPGAVDDRAEAEE